MVLFLRVNCTTNDVFFKLFRVNCMTNDVFFKLWWRDADGHTVCDPGIVSFMIVLYGYLVVKMGLERITADMCIFLKG